MTNREKYKQAFSAIRASDNFSLEAEKMERTAKQHRFRTMAAVVAVCATLVGGRRGRICRRCGWNSARRSGLDPRRPNSGHDSI